MCTLKLSNTIFLNISFTGYHYSKLCRPKQKSLPISQPKNQWVKSGNSYLRKTNFLPRLTVFRSSNVHSYHFRITLTIKLFLTHFWWIDPAFFEFCIRSYYLDFGHNKMFRWERFTLTLRNCSIQTASLIYYLL